ncbi:MAG: type II toxin-antitoxin system VapC family toxin [Betaproteobacteria bacterium]|nr:type II toxin-antitoxin system VapC family toxin [Betaproteobacteria bacterium]
MRLLLDTHLVLWWEAGHPRLPGIVQDLVRKEAEAVFVSRVSLWEIAIKVSNGRLKVDIAKFARNVEKNGFEWLDIRNEHILAVTTLPTFEDHRDPFDRLLVAQSQTEPLVLLTADSALGRYGQTVRVV